jgi:hypothetical protein
MREMVYCPKCRDFFEADSEDIGTYFCQRCNKVKDTKDYLQLCEELNRLSKKGNEDEKPSNNKQ